MKLIFIDTNVFISAVTCNYSDKVLSLLFKQLDKDKVVIIVPDVIKMEIVTQYSNWKMGVLENIKSNLTTKKILGIEDLTDKNKGQKKKNKGETESEKIDSVIALHREKMLKKIEKHYESTLKNIHKYFNHKNTSIVSLTDRILLDGMKRSLLKKSPYTKTDKSTENAHTKDIDCIAFEAVVDFCNKRADADKKDLLIMCVSDKDYIKESGDLHDDIELDIKMNHNCYESVEEMFDKEFSIKIGGKVKTKKNLSAELSLFPQLHIVEGSIDTTSSELTSNF